MSMQTAASLLLGLLCAAAFTGCPPHNPTPVVSSDRPHAPDVLLPAR